MIFSSNHHRWLLLPTPPQQQRSVSTTTTPPTTTNPDIVWSVLSSGPGRRSGGSRWPRGDPKKGPHKGPGGRYRGSQSTGTPKWTHFGGTWSRKWTPKVDPKWNHFMDPPGHPLVDHHPTYRHPIRSLLGGRGGRWWYPSRGTPKSTPKWDPKWVQNRVQNDHF